MSGSGCCHPPRMTEHYRYPQQLWASILWSLADVRDGALRAPHQQSRKAWRPSQGDQGEERDRIWEQQKRDAPGFAEYETKTTRRIPVIVLTPTV